MKSKEFDPLLKFHFKSILNRKELSLSVRQELASCERQLVFKKNQIIYEEGSFSKGAYILEKGIVKAYQQNFNGSKQIIYFYTPGEVFGYRQLLSKETQPVSTVALEPVVLKFIGGEDFLNIVQTSKELSNQLLYMLSKEFSMWIYRINVFAQKNVRERLALALLILNEKFKINKEELATIRLSKTDLANYVGTSLEVVVRLLKELAEQELIAVQGKEIKIKKRLQLYRISGIS